MSKTLMILAHPNIESSIGNKIISEAVSQQKNTEVRHLNQLYPDFKINIKAEQEALIKADTIIFQYPLFWYSIPAIMKEWIDQVIQYGFAFGSKYKLEGKKLVVSFTMGSTQKEFPPEVIEKITFPFRGLATYCKMEYKGEITSNDIHGYTDEAKENAVQNARVHVKQLLRLTI